jgi:hypothetical protein
MHGQPQQSPVQQQPASDGQEMQIKVISPSAEREEKSAQQSAVFVAHGMGQQRKFETLDQIASGLIKYDITVSGALGNKPEVITIDSGDGYLHGIKLRLNDGNAEHEVHIFEGYWAPLAEGTVNLRELMAFLVSAGFNGLAKSGQRFIRFLFDQRHDFGADFRATIYLLTAMLVVAALVLMNTAIVMVAALSSPLAKSPDWLAGLRPDLTTLFNLFLIVAGAFGLILYRSYTRFFNTGDGKRKELPNKRRRRLIKLSIALFIVTIVTTIACGLAIPLLFYGHVYGRQPQPSLQTEYLKEAFGAGLVSIVNCSFSLILLLVVVVLLVRAWRKVKTILQQRKHAPSSNPLPKSLLWGAVVMLAIVLALDISLGVTILRHLFGSRSWSTAFSSIRENPWATLNSVCDSLSVLSWPLLIAVSWYVRKMLVQYVGDVAVYVTSHKLDRFNSLREKIRETVYTAAEAVYKAPAAKGDGFAYDNVFIVGHSLGAVVVYDALNRLINEDELRKRKLHEDELRGRKLHEDELREQKLNVAGRTKLLLTFGSPQDKITFLFARPGPKGTGTGFIPIREALVAAAQPLVQSAKFRQCKWINIYSNLDIISGRLDFFDSPAQGGSGTGNRPRKPEDIPEPQRVDNRIDEEARTLLAAHIEYWDNLLLYRILREQITKRR